MDVMIVCTRLERHNCSHRSIVNNKSSFQPVEGILIYIYIYRYLLIKSGHLASLRAPVYVYIYIRVSE